MKISDRLSWRYAVKHFEPRGIVPEYKVLELKKAFQLTPSSFGLQPFRLTTVSDSLTKLKLLDHTYGQEQFVNASHILVISTVTQIDEEYIRGFFNLPSISGTSESKVSEGYQDYVLGYFSKMSPLEKKIWAINQAYLAMGVLLSACSTERIDSCPMEGFNKEGFDKILGLKEKKLASCLALPIGMRSASDARAHQRKIRFPYKELFQDN